MKMSKRIFVCLIVLAIGVSMLAFGASAEEPAAELKYTPANHATILEYYEEPIIFDMNFDDATTGTGYTHDRLFQLSGINSAINKATIVEETDGNKYLSISGAAIPPQTPHAFLTWNAEEGKNIDDFLMSFSLKAKGTGANLLIDLLVSDSPTTANTDITSSKGTSLIKFNFKGGKIICYDGSETGVVTDVALATDTFYDVSLNYSVINGTYSFSVSDTEGNVLHSASDLPIPYTTIGNVRIGSLSGNMTNNTISFDNVSAAGGSSIRYEADKLPETERAISDFIAICESEDVAIEDKVAVLKTAFALVLEHGYAGEDEAAQANVLAVQKLGVSTFIGQVDSRLALLTDTLAYDERVTLVEECGEFIDLLPEDISYMGDELEAIEATVATYEEELAKLPSLKEHSEAILAALADVALTNTNIRSYSYIRSYYDAIVDYTPYLGYPGIAEIKEAYDTVLAKYAELTDLGNEFIATALAAADMETSFGARYTAYVAARDNYFDDASFPGIDEAYAAFASADEEMTVAIDICEHFLLNVSRADYSQYLSAKKSALDAASRGAYEEGTEAPAADTQFNLINEKYLEYPGIPAAVELYAALLAEVAANEDAATRYVSAVQALAEIASGLSKTELAAKIAEAEALQESGNVIGVEGVTEANIILNNLKSQLELSEGYKSQFTGVVQKLDATSVAPEIFELAHEAYDVIANAEKYEGVISSDVEKLTAKVNGYNEKIRALNAGFAAANELAFNTVSASSGSPSDNAPVGLVATVIKKFYE